jgi:hypothetical protein
MSENTDILIMPQWNVKGELFDDNHTDPSFFD